MIADAYTRAQQLVGSVLPVPLPAVGPTPVTVDGLAPFGAVPGEVQAVVGERAAPWLEVRLADDAETVAYVPLALFDAPRGTGSAPPDCVRRADELRPGRR